MSTGVIELLAMLGLLAEKGGGGGGGEGPPGPPGPPAPYTAPGELPALPGDVPVPSGYTAPPPSAVPVPVGPLAPPGTLPPMPPWPTVPVPAGLPPFPGPGWTPDMPVTAPLASRAAYWNPSLWDYPTKTMRRPYVQEQLGGQWVTFAAAWHPGSAGPKTYMATEAWRLASAPPIAPPAPGQPTHAMPPPGVLDKPGPVNPYPGPSAFSNNAAYIKRYQAALSWLAGTTNHPAWSPGLVDGKLGPNTTSAVKAFQRDHALTQDGQAGPQVAAALDIALGYAAGTPAQPAPPMTPPPMGAPLRVSPYPGVGAYKTNAAYITRYQDALTYLAHLLGHPDWDPGGIDGKYGPKTVSAVKAFQKAMGLPVDGMAGASTAAKLDWAVTGQAAA